METMFDGLSDMTKDYDLIIKCKDDVKLHVHSLIMSKWSTVFRCMPDTNENFKPEGSPASVNVEEDAGVWRELLGLIYPATPVTILEWDNVDRVFHLADKYDMPGVLERCEAFLLGHKNTLSNYIGDTNYVLRWLAFAAKFDQSGLREKCMHYIRLNHRAIDELRNPKEDGVLKSELATTPAGVDCIVEILSFVLQQRR